jgi:hypothetical protein
VTRVLQRAVDFFLAPATARPTGTAIVPTAARAVVLGSPADAVPLAAAAALSLRAAAGAPTAVVAAWSPDASRAVSPAAAAHGAARPSHGLAARGAARLAARLSAHSLEAVARGRLVWLTLPAEPPAAATAVRRASAIVEGPLVTAVTGPRPAVLDDLLAEHDVVVVAGDPATALARAALARLTDRGIAARACRPLGRGLPRALALAGLAAPRLDAGATAAAREES